MHSATVIQQLKFDGLGWPITDSKRPVAAIGDLPASVCRAAIAVSRVKLPTDCLLPHSRHAHHLMKQPKVI